MKGQLTIWDAKKPTRPCDYRFQRYIGQKVELMIGAYGHGHKILKGTITGIKPYYTDVKVGSKTYAGTPYNTAPALNGIAKARR